MPEENHEDKLYPVKSLHDFLFELEKEWTKFRNGTLIGLASSAVLFIVVVWLIIRIRHFGLGLVDFAFLIIVGVVLGYAVYAMVAQYRFLNKWERRIGLLLHVEEEMMSEKLGDNKGS